MVSDIKPAAGEVPSSGEPAPLFWVHEDSQRTDDPTNPAPLPVLSASAVHDEGNDCELYILLLMLPDGRLDEDVHSFYYVCRGAACMIQGCTRAVQTEARPESAEWIAALRQHWLAGVDCDSPTRTARARCACSEVDLGWHQGVGAAVDSYIRHLARKAVPQ